MQRIQLYWGEGALTVQFIVREWLETNGYLSIHEYDEGGKTVRNG